KETDLTVPYRNHGFWYYNRTVEGKPYPIYCRNKGSLDAPEDVILDQNALAQGKRFHALGGFDVSPDGSRLLYLEDTTAFREYTLYVKDLGSGRLTDSIPGVWNGTAWADDNRTVFYRPPESDPGPAHWTDWLPHRDSVFVENLDAFKDFVVVSERSGGLRRLRVTDLRTNRSHYVTFPEVAYGVFPAGNPEFDTGTFRFSYSSLVTPSSVYDYDLRSRARVLKKRQEIPSGYDGGQYEVRRLMAPARDGVRVPVSLLLRRGTPLDGSRPVLLYAYGSYGATIEPTFNSNVLSLVDRGFIYAIAHIRGGQEMGRRWYDDGKMMHKLNTFRDYIDVGEELVRLKYTSRDRLVANGGSAGGLLMGAVVNMRPDLFRAVVADVPFVDVINTMLDASLPLTAQEWDQWGNPHIAEQYAYMR